VAFVVVLDVVRAASKGAVGAAVGERSHPDPTTDVVSAIARRRTTVMASLLLLGAENTGRE
jgi:hypothetical protein